MICGIVLRQYRNVTDTGALQTSCSCHIACSMSATRQVFWPKALVRCHTCDFLARFCRATKSPSVTWRVARFFHGRATLFSISAVLYSMRPCWWNSQRWLVSRYCLHFAVDSRLVFLLYIFTFYRTYLIYCCIYFVLYLCMNKMEWSDAKINQLIELYEKKPVLYDFTMKDHHNRVLKLQAWDDIAKECGIPGLEFCILAPDSSSFTESHFFVLLMWLSVILRPGRTNVQCLVQCLCTFSVRGTTVTSSEYKWVYHGLKNIAETNPNPNRKSFCYDTFILCTW